jgi:hypothetical protein
VPQLAATDDMLETKVIEDYTGKAFAGERANSHPDLLLA